MILRSLLLAGTAVALAGCAGPSRTPPADAAGALPAAPPPAFAAAAPAGPYAGVDWAGEFDDPGLAAAVAEALARNPDLAAARARLDQARARARQARAARLPDVDAGLAASETRAGDGAATGRASVDLDVSWEADLWGRLGDRAGASGLAAEAAAADLAAARLSIAGAAASAWIDLAEARRLHALAQEETARRDASQRVVERRFARGLVEATDVRLARSATANARAGAEQAGRLADDAARRLEILTARYPAAAAGREARIPGPTAAPPAGAPGDLLLRRPDLAAAERHLAAAGLEAEAARKAMLPSLRLTGGLSGAGGDLADAFDPDAIVQTLVASLAVPIFRGGALAAQSEEAQARAREAAAGYAAATLTAWREAEDALAADAELARRSAFVADAFEQTRKAEERVAVRYGEGLASIFNLLDAQSRRQEAERQAIGLAADRARARVRLHLALGGGFAATELSAPTASPSAAP